MSDVMLHGVLNMPPELWDDSELDKMQRYSRYREASRKIEDLTDALLEALEWNWLDDDAPEDKRQEFMKLLGI